MEVLVVGGLVLFSDVSVINKAFHECSQQHASH